MRHLIVQVAGLHSRWTAIGAVVWLAARVVYLPIYALGITGIRTALFLVSVVGIGMGALAGTVLTGRRPCG